MRRRGRVEAESKVGQSSSVKRKETGSPLEAVSKARVPYMSLRIESIKIFVFPLIAVYLKHFEQL